MWEFVEHLTDTWDHHCLLHRPRSEKICSQIQGQLCHMTVHFSACLLHAPDLWNFNNHICTIADCPVLTAWSLWLPLHLCGLKTLLSLLAPGSENFNCNLNLWTSTITYAQSLIVLLLDNRIWLSGLSNYTMWIDGSTYQLACSRTRLVGLQQWHMHDR